MDRLKDLGDYYLIDDRYAIYKKNGVVFDTITGKDIPSWVFIVRDTIMGAQIKTYELYHLHNNKLWGLGVRTREQVECLMRVSDHNIINENGDITMSLGDMFSEPVFKAVLIEK